MQIVANIDPGMPLRDVASYARRVEALGYDALHVAETIHDPFAVSLLALEHSTALRVRTGVALAFPRSPMVVAYASWDLASFSGGRFDLGLGTQIRANIEERYSAPFGDPVARMRDYVGALRAIFTSFQEEVPLRYESEHYIFTRLQPYFNPGPLDTSPPAIWLGGVNAKMCRLAGEVADGFITHPTNSTRSYLETLCLPNLETGAKSARRTLADVPVIAGAPVVTGASASAMGAERERQRASLGMLFSTPAYRPTLELSGWTELGDRLRAAARADRWEELASLVSDEVLDAVVLHATYDDLAGAIDERYDGCVAGVLIPPPSDPSFDEAFAAAIADVRRGVPSQHAHDLSRAVRLRPREG